MLGKVAMFCSMVILLESKSNYQDKIREKIKAKNRQGKSSITNPMLFVKPKLPHYWFLTRLLSTNRSTVDADEILTFQNYSKDWWDELSGPMKPLHSFNKIRIPFIRDGLVNVGTIDNQTASCPQPFKGLKILDLGCGGGILAEPLSRLGGQVTGVDATSDLIKIAQDHAKQQNIAIDYVCSTIEDHAKENPEEYDIIVASEILEHITEKEEFLNATCQCLKPKGSLFVTTLSKTFLAHVVGIWMAEYFLHFIPKGTHQYEKFITPETLTKMLKERNLVTKTVHGMFYNPMSNSWSWFFDKSLSYGLHAIKRC